MLAKFADFFDKCIVASNKINSQTIVVFMFSLGVVVALRAAHMNNLTDKAQIELFGLASALVTGGLGMLNGNKKESPDIPPGKSATQTTETTTVV